MNTNEQYLKDFLLQREEFMKFEKECESIADKADIIASENIKKYDEI